MEALLLAHQFECHSQLAQTLDTLLAAVDELFNSHFSVMGDGENKTIRLANRTPSVQPTVPLGLRLLEAIVSAGQRYMVEFEKLGLLQGGSLQDQSMVLSDMSEGGRRASLRLRATNLEQTQQPTVSKGSFEELSILLSLKDLLLPQLHDTPSLSTFTLLLSDLFHGCEVTEMMAHERQLRESLAERAMEDREAGESARESRAASAMMVVREDSRLPSEVTSSLEEHIVQACLLDNLVPSPSFQLAVSQLLCLSQSHTIVGVVGDSCSGKSSVINVAADTLRGQGAGLTVSWVVPSALESGELFGKEVEG